MSGIEEGDRRIGSSMNWGGDNELMQVLIVGCQDVELMIAPADFADYMHTFVPANIVDVRFNVADMDEDQVMVDNLRERDPNPSDVIHLLIIHPSPNFLTAMLANRVDAKTTARSLYRSAKRHIDRNFVCD